MTRHSIHLAPLPAMLAYSGVLALAGQDFAATVISTFVIVVAIVNLQLRSKA